MFVFVGVFSVIVWYMRKSMPESPRWYESKGMEENAQHVVNIFYHEAEKEADNSIAQPSVIRKEHGKESGKFSDLFSKNMISRTIVGCVVLIAINTLIYTFVSWAPTFFLRKGINVSKSLGYTTIMMIGAPLGALIGSFIVDKLGRKWCLTVFMLAAGALGYAYASQNTMAVILTMGFFLTVIIYILLTLGLAIYVPELFPTDIRLRGSGFCNAVGRLATIFSPYGVAWILKNYDTRTVFIVLGCILVVVAFIIAVLGVETKQKSLDEI
jgi:putative MFS transporter